MARSTRARSLDFDVPDRIGKYEVGQCLGSGTCGVVYKGYDPIVQRKVAIKLSLNDVGTGNGKFPALQHAFVTEAAAAGKLKHPHIVALYDVGSTEERLNYLIMEYICGTQLSNYGKGQKPLPPLKVLEIIFESANALDYSHSQGIIHRDIKPSNIMLTEEGITKVLDFGIAVSTAKKTIRKGGPTVGTPNYMSPEQVLGGSLGPQSDLYSLATVMFEMLTGRQLFKASKVKDLFRCVASETPPCLSDIRPDLPIQLTVILNKALQKSPDERYQTGAEFARVISNVMDSMRPVSASNNWDERRITLREQQILKELTGAEVDQLAKFSGQIHYKAGDVILVEGEADEYLYIVVSGELVARCSGRLMEVIGRGECFGEMGFIIRELSVATIEVLSPVCLYRVDREIFENISSNTRLHYYRIFSKMLSAHLATLDKPRIDYAL
jgi:serine/threonine protein kinase